MQVHGVAAFRVLACACVRMHTDSACVRMHIDRDKGMQAVVLRMRPADSVLCSFVLAFAYGRLPGVTQGAALGGEKGDSLSEKEGHGRSHSRQICQGGQEQSAVATGHPQV